MATSATETTLPIRDFPGGAALAPLVVPPTASTKPYVEALAAGRLTLQRCGHCRRCRRPIAPVCPYCDSSDFDWIASGGHGRVVSFVRYRRNYLPEFETLVPYVVLCVELAEGPRLFGRLADAAAAPYIGMPVDAIIERWGDGGHAPAFVPGQGAG